MSVGKRSLALRHGTSTCFIIVLPPSVKSVLIAGSKNRVILLFVIFQDETSSHKEPVRAKKRKRNISVQQKPENHILDSHEISHVCFIGLEISVLSVCSSILKRKRPIQLKQTSKCCKVYLVLDLSSPCMKPSTKMQDGY